MARKTTPLITNNFYHVVSRGNNQQNIFQKKSDYYRLLRNMFEFNDENTILSTYRSLLTFQPNSSGSDPDELGVIVKERQDFRHRDKIRIPLVDILVFCFMPNHFHLLLRQLKDGGISEFMKKVKGGYATFWDKKYNKTGSLFQSHVKAVEIKSDEQLNTIFSYIHTNPCQLAEPEWKTAGLKNTKEALDVLNSYRWSSYLDYTGTKNFPSLTNRTLFSELYGGPKGCKEAVEGWVKYKSDSYEDIRDIALE